MQFHRDGRRNERGMRFRFVATQLVERKIANVLCDHEHELPVDGDDLGWNAHRIEQESALLAFREPHRTIDFRDRHADRLTHYWFPVLRCQLCVDR